MVIISNATAYIAAITWNVFNPPNDFDNSWHDIAIVPNGNVMAQYDLLNIMKPVNNFVKGFRVDGL